ncbi:4-hydroxy-3-methylbut-2-enyl diphosphate reductase [Cutibacterium acnes JCM 18918]|nr:4-hydroxy-3-methylbut-2-enyl diphosphate reductase [Cutibacterium acnes JCM 18918]
MTVEKALEVYGAPVYVRKQIVHNRHVVETLEGRGAIFVDELDEVPDDASWCSRLTACPRKLRKRPPIVVFVLLTQRAHW